MKRLRSLFVVVVISTVAAFGCGDDGSSNGSSNSNGTDTGSQTADAGDDSGGSNGFIPEANSSAFATVPWTDPDVDETYYATLGIAIDHGDICSTIADSCTADSEEIEARGLVLTLIAAEQYKTGTYTIGPFDEEDLTPDSLLGSARIEQLRVGEDDPEVEASAGTVTVTTFDAQQFAGTYELTFEGTEYTGSFDIEFCQKLLDNLEC